MSYLLKVCVSLKDFTSASPRCSDSFILVRSKLQSGTGGKKIYRFWMIFCIFMCQFAGLFAVTLVFSSESLWSSSFWEEHTCLHCVSWCDHMMKTRGVTSVQIYCRSVLWQIHCVVRDLLQGKEFLSLLRQKDSFPPILISSPATSINDSILMLWYSDWSPTSLFELTLISGRYWQKKNIGRDLKQIVIKL